MLVACLFWFVMFVTMVVLNFCFLITLAMIVLFCCMCFLVFFSVSLIILDELLDLLAYVGFFHLVVVVLICLISSMLLLWLFANDVSKTLPWQGYMFAALALILQYRLYYSYSYYFHGFIIGCLLLISFC
jgi:hypothetical protein